MTIIKEGSKWSGSSGAIFRVINIIQIEGHTWIHYIKDNAPEESEREYSCYLESFTSRFSPLPKDR
jgi:hypothetical protein